MRFPQQDLVRLHSGISGISQNNIREILQYCHDNEQPLADIFQLTDSEFSARFPNIRNGVRTLLLNSSAADAENTLEQLTRKGFKVITFLDDEYPPQYATFRSAMPALLYVFGDPAILHKPGIGFGGSRDVSEDGLHATDDLARHVVKAFGCTVISGHAKGVDLIAHVAAVAAGGETILVLPEGALTFRLHELLRTYWQEARDRLLIMSQFAPHEPWRSRNAMMRNASVIGLAQAFCVIEAGDEKGGTWEAGKTALRLGRPLYVLKYDVPPKSPLGNEKLIGMGGRPIPHKKVGLEFPALDQYSSPDSEAQDPPPTEDLPTQPKLFD